MPVSDRRARRRGGLAVLPHADDHRPERLGLEQRLHQLGRLLAPWRPSRRRARCHRRSSRSGRTAPCPTAPRRSSMRSPPTERRRRGGARAGTKLHGSFRSAGEVEDGEVGRELLPARPSRTLGRISGVMPTLTLLRGMCTSSPRPRHDVSREDVRGRPRRDSRVTQRLAEGVGFEPTVSCPTHAFQACRFGRSRTPPEAGIVLAGRDGKPPGGRGYPRCGVHLPPERTPPARRSAPHRALAHPRPARRRWHGRRLPRRPAQAACRHQGAAGRPRP